jgi:hypothetical protein
MNWDQRRLALTRAILVFACFLPLACSRSSPGAKVKVCPVRGEVFVDGQPASGAVVHFHPLDKEQGPPAFAIVQEDGSFQLSTFSNFDGAAPGEYAVTINWRDQRQTEEETVIGPDRLGERYSKPDLSKLDAMVVQGENTLDRFDLKK